MTHGRTNETNLKKRTENPHSSNKNKMNVKLHEHLHKII